VAKRNRRPRPAYMIQLWSKCIRERDDYVCQECGRNFRHEPGALQAAHHIAKGMGGRSPKMKYYIDNGAALCIMPGKYPRGCHPYMDNHPLEHAKWVFNYLGEDRYEALVELNRTTDDSPKWLDGDYWDLVAVFNATLKDLRARRAAGQQGVLEI
jgi:hypothetical protein